MDLIDQRVGVQKVGVVALAHLAFRVELGNLDSQMLASRVYSHCVARLALRHVAGEICIAAEPLLRALRLVFEQEVDVFFERIVVHE